MKYRSTRGGVAGVSFLDSLLMGLAEDGGLLLPETIPDVTASLEAWRSLSFVELAQQVIALYVDDIERNELDEIIAQAYASFSHPEVVALRQLDDIAVLELFHGPTLAFKDVALQLVGKLFELALERNGAHLNILGATSGDTGSAAIAGVRGQRNIDIFILYPNNKVSALQELQMTTVPDENVHCIAIEGSFDDCQSLMKNIFGDLHYKQELNLGAVNSVNWARVLAQIVYYGYASLRMEGGAHFCVPTGNFGNVFAGYIARRMGFPIRQLVVATNENDILARFFDSGEYARSEVHFTLSPAMDIQVASNFERFLFYLFDEDSTRLLQFMEDFQNHGTATLGDAWQGAAAHGFLATAIDTEETLAAVAEAYREHDYVLDPHTAVGVAAASKVRDQLVDGQLVCVGTAHPAKFPEAVQQALPDVTPTHPTLEALRGLPQRKTVLAADEAVIKAHIQAHAHGSS